MFKIILARPPYYNIRNPKYSFSQMQVDLFMTFDQFKDQLGSWEKPLGAYTQTKTFQNIYKFVKQ